MTTKTDAEQERADFEAWRIKHYNYDDLDAFEVSFAFEAFKAGRAALQSQDRADAEEVAATLATVLHFIPKQEEPELYTDVEKLCAEFGDRARRAEGGNHE